MPTKNDICSCHSGLSQPFCVTMNRAKGRHLKRSEHFFEKQLCAIGRKEKVLRRTVFTETEQGKNRKHHLTSPYRGPFSKQQSPSSQDFQSFPYLPNNGTCREEKETGKDDFKLPSIEATNEGLLNAVLEKKVFASRWKEGIRDSWKKDINMRPVEDVCRATRNIRRLGEITELDKNIRKKIVKIRKEINNSGLHLQRKVYALKAEERKEINKMRNKIHNIHLA